MSHEFHLDSILFNLNTHVESLSWSPDGKKLIYELKENRFYVTEIDPETLEIVEEKQVLGKEEAIRYLGGDAVTDKNFEEYFIYPQWSPVDNRVLITKLGKELGDEEIWVLDLDSGKMEKLIERAGAPKWSPDGKKFSFLRYDKGKKEPTVWIATFED
ncbi:MAG: TolB family protein [bacterium]